MTIASKLYFLQRPRAGRRSQPDATELPSPRRAGGGARSGDDRRLISSQSGKSSSSYRLQKSRQILVNDECSRSKDELEERLPDTVRQARERLALRLRSINLSGSRGSDIGLENQPSICLSQSDAVQLFFKFTKKPILDISQVVQGLKHVIFKCTDDCEITGTSLVECSICLEKFLEGEVLTQLNCKHTFHSGCLTRWVQNHSDCPYCRAPVA